MTFREYFEKEEGLEGMPWENWDSETHYEYKTREIGWNACLKEVSEELRNILEYVGNDIDESVVIRIADFCKQIFKETHDE